MCQWKTVCVASIDMQASSSVDIVYQPDPPWPPSLSLAQHGRHPTKPSGPNPTSAMLRHVAPRRPELLLAPTSTIAATQSWSESKIVQWCLARFGAVTARSVSMLRMHPHEVFQPAPGCKDSSAADG